MRGQRFRVFVFGFGVGRAIDGRLHEVGQALQQRDLVDRLDAARRASPRADPSRAGGSCRCHRLRRPTWRSARAGTAQPDSLSISSRAPSVVCSRMAAMRCARRSIECPAPRIVATSVRSSAVSVVSRAGRVTAIDSRVARWMSARSRSIHHSWYGGRSRGRPSARDRSARHPRSCRRRGSSRARVEASRTISGSTAPRGHTRTAVARVASAPARAGQAAPARGPSRTAGKCGWPCTAGARPRRPPRQPSR